MIVSFIILSRLLTVPFSIIESHPFFVRLVIIFSVSTVLDHIDNTLQRVDEGVPDINV